MKKIKFPAVVMIFTAHLFITGMNNADAQILKKLKKQAENAATKKMEQKTEKETNKTIDGVLDGEGDNTGNDVGNPATNSTKTINDKTVTTPASEKEKITMYSKSDWIAGEDLILFEDFSKDPVGDFPQLWNTSSSGEVITLSDNPDTKWLRMYNYGTYQPDLPKELPKDFTIEFDAVAYGVSKEKTSQTARFTVSLGDGKHPLKGGVSYIYTHLPVYQGWAKPIYSESRGLKMIGATKGMVEKEIREQFLKGCHVAISGKDQRYRLYINGQKIVDMPRGLPADEEIKTLLFSTYGLKNGDEHMLITNLRIAEGLPEPRAKLFSTGKYETNAILFDFNSAAIKPESFGVLREISEALKTESGKKVKVVGHTDSDGSDTYNMELSKKRAMSVKDALVNNFGVSSNQLSTDGKGETEPVSPNDTVSGKAKNRRTAFIVQ